MVYKIAVTGNFGTGKSSVGKILEELGYVVIDTDVLVHNILKEKNYATEKIISIFGESVINSDFSQSYINRAELGKIVFSDKNLKKQLEEIIHPIIRKNLSQMFNLYADKKFIFVLIPLLFESKLEKFYDETWCVVCDAKSQFERLEKKGISPEQIEKRLSTQMPQYEKSRKANFIVDNSGSIESTKNQILEKLKQLPN